MYKLKYIYICDHCGAIALPYVSDCGSLRPDNWGSIGDKIHLCPKCYRAYIELMGEDEEYDEDCT